MKIRLQRAIMLLRPPASLLPSNEAESELFVSLVEGWVHEHGEEWVRNNFLLEMEWRRCKSGAALA